MVINKVAFSNGIYRDHVPKDVNRIHDSDSKLILNNVDI